MKLSVVNSGDLFREKEAYSVNHNSLNVINLGENDLFLGTYDEIYMIGSIIRVNLINAVMRNFDTFENVY